MKKVATLKSLANIANELDVLGLKKEANAITAVMYKIAYDPTKPFGGILNTPSVSNSVSLPSNAPAAPTSSQAKNYFALANIQGSYVGSAEQNEALRSAIASENHLTGPQTKDLATVFQAVFGYPLPPFGQKRYDVLSGNTNQTPIQTPTQTPTWIRPQAPQQSAPSPQVQPSMDFTSVTAYKQKFNFLKQSQQQNPIFLKYENALKNNIIPLFQATKVSFDNCYRLSGDPTQQGQTLKFGNQFMDQMEKIVTYVQQSLSSNELSPANKLSFKKSAFGSENEKNSPMAKVIMVRQIADNIANYFIRSGSMSGDAPKLWERANNMLALMQSVES
jgi:hypothetical protein